MKEEHCEHSSADDDRTIKALWRILDKGNNAEVKKGSDGKMIVYEVKKNIVTAG